MVKPIWRRSLQNGRDRLLGLFSNSMIGETKMKRAAAAQSLRLIDDRESASEKQHDQTQNTTRTPTLTQLTRTQWQRLSKSTTTTNDDFASLRTTQLCPNVKRPKRPQTMRRRDMCLDRIVGSSRQRQSNQLSLATTDSRGGNNGSLRVRACVHTHAPYRPWSKQHEPHSI